MELDGVAFDALVPAGHPQLELFLTRCRQRRRRARSLLLRTKFSIAPATVLRFTGVRDER